MTQNDEEAPIRIMTEDHRALCDRAGEAVAQEDYSAGQALGRWRGKAHELGYQFNDDIGKWVLEGETMDERKLIVYTARQGAVWVGSVNADRLKDGERSLDNIAGAIICEMKEDALDANWEKQVPHGAKKERNNDHVNGPDCSMRRRRV